MTATAELTTYSVVGIWVDDEPVVAAVLEGQQYTVDAGASDPDFERWSITVEAEDPDAAEAYALAVQLGEDDEDERGDA
ncbi:hypothetical protein ACQPW3_36370 [Actinosynnema sp. CA-248983]